MPVECGVLFSAVIFRHLFQISNPEHNECNLLL
jgi:hypothetical protein